MLRRNTELTNLHQAKYLHSSYHNWLIEKNNVLKCVNPTGVIAAYKVQPIEWIFRPLECRKYEWDISVHIGDSKEVDCLILLTGSGTLVNSYDITVFFKRKRYLLFKNPGEKMYSAPQLQAPSANDLELTVYLHLCSF